MMQNITRCSDMAELVHQLARNFLATVHGLEDHSHH